jgi:hypothetical protein
VRRAPELRQQWQAEVERETAEQNGTASVLDETMRRARCRRQAEPIPTAIENTAR